MDPLGTILIMAAIISYILGVQYGGSTHPWKSSTVTGLLVGSALMTVTFAIWESFQGERAALVPRLIRDPSILVNSLYSFFFVGAYFDIVYYIPIYFQSIQNVSASNSGVRNLPLIIAVSISLIISGGSIAKTGTAAPLLVVGGVLSTIASGLLYTLEIGTSTGKWIGYQILGGVGWGLAYQVPMMIAQAGADPKDLSSVTGIILCKGVPDIRMAFN